MAHMPVVWIEQRRCVDLQQRISTPEWMLNVLCALLSPAEEVLWFAIDDAAAENLVTLIM